MYRVQGVINRLREEVKAQKKSDVHVQTSSMDKGKGKRITESVLSLVSEDEEQATVPLVTKGRRSSPARTRTFYIPQAYSVPQISTIPTPQTATISSAPSLDEDDHLTTKKA